VPTSVSAETTVNAPKIVTFEASATDNIDGPVPVNCTPASGSSFAIGTTPVSCTATDSHGNTGTAHPFNVTVMLVGSTTPVPPAGTTPTPLPQPPARTPLDEVRGLKATVGSRKVTLAWTNPTAASFDHVGITRTLADGSASIVLYMGSGTTYVDTFVQNGVEYRYTIATFDKQGNRSAGVVVAAVPKQSLLLTPPDGAQVKRTKKIVRLSWTRMRGVDYYNVQLFFAPDLRSFGVGGAKRQARVKVLSVWPKKNVFLLKKTWKFAGVRYRRQPGIYRWYVWPGHGNRKHVDYGPLMGSSTFMVIP
jgi:hypothetical protein